MKILKRKVFGLVVAVLLVASFCFAADGIISVQNTALTIAASGTKYSDPIDLSGKEGYFSIQTVVSGSGTLTISYQMSNSTQTPFTWSTPAGASDIATGLTAATYLHKFEPYTVAKWLRLSFTETGTSDTVTIITNLASQ